MVTTRGVGESEAREVPGNEGGRRVGGGEKKTRRENSWCMGRRTVVQILSY